MHIDKCEEKNMCKMPFASLDYVVSGSCPGYRQFLICELRAEISADGRFQRITVFWQVCVLAFFSVPGAQSAL